MPGLGLLPRDRLGSLLVETQTCDLWLRRAAPRPAACNV